MLGTTKVSVAFVPLLALNVAAIAVLFFVFSRIIAYIAMIFFFFLLAIYFAVYRLVQRSQPPPVNIEVHHVETLGVQQPMYPIHPMMYFQYPQDQQFFPMEPQILLYPQGQCPSLEITTQIPSPQIVIQDSPPQLYSKDEYDSLLEKTKCKSEEIFNNRNFELQLLNNSEEDTFNKSLSSLNPAIQDWQKFKHSNWSLNFSHNISLRTLFNISNNTPVQVSDFDMNSLVHNLRKRNQSYSDFKQELLSSYNVTDYDDIFLYFINLYTGNTCYSELSKGMIEDNADLLTKYSDMISVLYLEMAMMHMLCVYNVDKGISKPKLGPLVDHFHDNLNVVKRGPVTYQYYPSLYRYVNNETKEALLSSIIDGKWVVFNSFISTTATAEPSVDAEKPFTIVILNAYGMDVSGVSQYNSEEILLMPLCRYFIRGIQEDTIILEATWFDPWMLTLFNDFFNMNASHFSTLYDIEKNDEMYELMNNAHGRVLAPSHNFLNMTNMKISTREMNCEGFQEFSSPLMLMKVLQGYNFDRINLDIEDKDKLVYFDFGDSKDPMTINCKPKDS